MTDTYPDDVKSKEDSSLEDIETQLLQIPVSAVDLESNEDIKSSQLQSHLTVDDMEDDLDEDVDEEDFSISDNKDDKYIVSVEESYNNYYTKEKTTSPLLTKFERAKLLGIRAEMISAGNPPLVVVPRGVDNAYEIALLELNEKKIPLIIRRRLPNGNVEDWRIEELIIKSR